MSSFFWGTQLPSGADNPVPSSDTVYGGSDSGGGTLNGSGSQGGWLSGVIGLIGAAGNAAVTAIRASNTPTYPTYIPQGATINPATGQVVYSQAPLVGGLLSGSNSGLILILAAGALIFLLARKR